MLCVCISVSGCRCARVCIRYMEGEYRVCVCVYLTIITEFQRSRQLKDMKTHQRHGSGLERVTHTDLTSQGDLYHWSPSAKQRTGAE